jgi:N-hydroxyarylamine O-acetyltransferase
MKESTVKQYLQRIDYTGPTDLTISTLKALHLAHMMAVPFENLDIALGKKLSLDTDTLLNKVINLRRGGFCYELNYTFSLLLTALGFKVKLLAAQVYGKGKYGPPFDHLLLLVEHQNAQWIADVGFGDSFVEPLPLNGPEQTQMDSRYKLVKSAEYFELFREKSDQDWQPQYRFELIDYKIGDFELMCEFQQTSPESGFSHKSVCSIMTKQGRKTISNGFFIDSTGKTRSKLPIETDSQYQQILQRHFKISLSDDTCRLKICADNYTQK